MSEFWRLRQMTPDDIAREIYKYSRTADDKIDDMGTWDEASVAVNEKRAMRALQVLAEFDRTRAEAIAGELGYPKP